MDFISQYLNVNCQHFDNHVKCLTISFKDWLVTSTDRVSMTPPSRKGFFPLAPTWEKFSSLKGRGTLAASEKMTNEVAPLLTISTRRNMHLPIAPLLGGKRGRRGED